MNVWIEFSAEEGKRLTALLRRRYGKQAELASLVKLAAQGRGAGVGKPEALARRH